MIGMVLCVGLATGIVLSILKIPPDTLLYVMLKGTGGIFASLLPIKYALDKTNTSFKQLLGNFHSSKYFIIPTVLLATGAALLDFPLGAMLIYTFYSVTKISIGNFTLPSLVDFLFAATAVPLLEETLFRGIILNGFLKKHNPLKSILISSALFGAMHINPDGVITSILLGILFSYIYIKTRSLWMCIIAHSIVNFMIGGSYINSFLLDKMHFDIRSHIFLGIILAIWGFYMLNKALSKNHREEAPTTIE